MRHFDGAWSEAKLVQEVLAPIWQQVVAELLAVPRADNEGDLKMIELALCSTAKRWPNPEFVQQPVAHLP